ncbi:MAG: hypothetical protein KAQ85_10750 [Thermodesulfovibrionia bacterium]|nr:hypothetical protein [Thermodesulfovibrionia bacterium]
MEKYYTEKEKHIHGFLLTKGWTDVEISKSIFHITKWTSVMSMPIELYYKLVMEDGNYAKYKEYTDYVESNGISPEGYLVFKKSYRNIKLILIFGISFVAAYLFILLIR